MNIGNVKLDNPYILAPMAGVTDLPFRLLCKEQGAGLLCMEMISAKALIYGNTLDRVLQLLEIHPEEYPVSLQLFGSDPEIMSEAAKRIEDRPFQILDINMGCPVPKVVKNGEGSALMNDPGLVRRIVEKVSRAIQKPVTVKIRKGFDDQHVNAVEIARIAEDAGASAGGGPRAYPGAVLLREGGLGHHPPGERGGVHPGDRKRRRGLRVVGPCHDGRDRLRWG